MLSQWRNQTFFRGLLAQAFFVSANIAGGGLQ
jgi:hypothetical protein